MTSTEANGSLGAISLVAACAVAVMLGVLVDVPGSAVPTAVPTPAPPALHSPGLVVDRPSTTRVQALVGTGTPADTGRRFGVEGTDLGHMFAHDGRIAVVFGDTYGAPPAADFFSVAHRDWRSNVMGFMSPGQVPGRGIALQDMVTDRAGHAKELIGSLKRRGVEETAIPTGGISVGGRMYLQYMSVRQFDEPGRWRTNYSAIVASNDDGRTWTREAGAVFGADSPFTQVAYADRDETANGAAPDDTIYVYGIPAGRYGSMSLARVTASRIAVPTAYQYWTGTGWSSNPALMTPVVAGPVGELSVRYNPFHHRWLMMYLVDPTGEIVLRVADRPTGPWSEPQVVTSTREFPQAYAPYLTPAWNAGSDIWFTLSQYDTYRVSLMRTRLGPLGLGVPLPADVRATPVTGTLLGPRPSHPYERRVAPEN